MVDVARATQLFGFGEQLKEGSDTYLELMGPGVVHADFGDPEHVFRVQVVQVPRQRLNHGPDPVVHQSGEIQVFLAGAAVANHVTLTFSATGTAAIATSDEYRTSWARWCEAPDGEPPTWPATALASMGVTLTDDVGTLYQDASSEAGTEADPWRCVRRFLPTPPPDAQMLLLRVASGEEIGLALPDWLGK